MRKKLLFVSPRFLFPLDSGGKIRTTQILRGMKGGLFEITLASPATPAECATHAEAIESVCDRFVSWPRAVGGVGAKIARAALLLSSLPLPVATDRSARGSAAVAAELAQGPDVVVFDFLHSVVLAPAEVEVPSVLFTHNVETEIFERHTSVSSGPRAVLWRNQVAKMQRFEGQALRRFDTVIAVSERDARVFATRHAAGNVQTIGTGVDLDYYAHSPPGDAQRVVFTGSMDWLANRDGIDFFLTSVWPLVAVRARCSMTVVGRDPPASLVRAAQRAGFDWEFTGYVDDVRPYVRAAGIYVIPLRVAGGTRLKVYEAMAMGCPVVSTSIGVEGLPLVAGEHYLRADEPAELADAIGRLVADAELRGRLSTAARAFVEQNCSDRAIARQFEGICAQTLQRRLSSG